MKYDEDYFERGIELRISGYSNYRWIPELTIPMCARIVENLNITDNDRILDYGCAKGFYVKAFRLLHKQCWGYDISKYALDNVDTEVKQYVSDNLKSLGNFCIVIAKDVLEHIDYFNINTVLREISRITDRLFCIIPLGVNDKYIVPNYELDRTHIIRENIYWWIEKFNKCGFDIVSAEYSMKYMKQNYSQWPKGNGFFMCKRN